MKPRKLFLIATLSLLSITSARPAELVIKQQAYLKASKPDGSDDIYVGDQFGTAVAMSGDTLLVGAPSESSGASGINGNQLDNSMPGSGAAYVFVRSGTHWIQQAYLKASNPDVDDQFGYSGSCAIDGDTLVVGAPLEDSGSAGINGNQLDNSLTNSGAVYVFVRTGTNWTQQAYLKASNPDSDNRDYYGGDFFGTAVAISGDTIVVGSYREDSNATGINGDQTSNTLTNSGAAYVFVRNGTNWTQQAYLKASNPDTQDFFGSSVAISGDTIVVGAQHEDSNAVGINGNQLDNSSQGSGAAYAFVRSGTNWTQQAYLKASNTEPLKPFVSQADFFGSAVAISGDTVVVGAYAEASCATGVNGDQSSKGCYGQGAVYVFVRNGANWSQEAYLKQPAGSISASQSGWFNAFGGSVALASPNLIIVRYWEGELDAEAWVSCALFQRGSSGWIEAGHLRAIDSIFGSEHVIAASGNVLALGSPFADTESGAVHVFTLSELLPSLAITPAGLSSAVISWPASFTNWNLQASTNLAGGLWSPPLEPTFINGTNKSVTIDTTSGNRFFRLVE